MDSSSTEKTCSQCKRPKGRELQPQSLTINENLQNIYSKLEPARKDIRHLVLFPGVEKEGIRCSLETVSLSSNPCYTALSYCWGDPKDRSEIIVNGQSISVTKSLESALRHMRKTDQALIVWADAICINQLDAAEKSFQVRMMGEIYASASSVWIWLGESKNNSDAAMKYIQTIHAVNFDNPDYHPDKKIWRAIRDLWQRPWFTRLWVVQEILLAKHATLNCGYISADIDCFVLLKDIQMIYSKVVDPRLRPMQYSLISPFSLVLWDWKRLKDSLSKGGVPLYQMITETGKMSCSLPEDKIFSILSLCPEFERQIIKVDYSVCVHCIVQHVAIYMLIRRATTSPLLVLQTHQINKMPFLLSWVPDYTKNDEESHFIFPASDGCMPYRAGANNAAWNALGLAPLHSLGLLREYDVDVSLNSLAIEFDEDNALIVPGLFFDTIKDVYLPTPVADSSSNPDLDETDTKRTRKESLIKDCREWELHVQNNLPAICDPYKTTCGISEAFWRTLIGDHFQDMDFKAQRPVQSEFAGQFEAWMGRGVRVNDPSYVKQFSDAAIKECMDRSFLVTDKGYLGLGPKTTKPGQWVCVLRGGNVPFVMNPNEGGYFELVGEAYIHGIMDGEIVHRAGEGDVKKICIR